MILHRLFDIIVTVYVDDFVVIEPAETVHSAVRTVQAVFKLLGWDEKPTTKVPSDLCEVLGVLLDLRAAHRGTVRIANRHARVADITQDIERALCTGSLSRREAEILKGRLGYVVGQTFAKAGAMASRVLQEHMAGGGGRLGPQAIWSLKW